MTNYKDLTGDDVLQAGDEWFDGYFRRWHGIPSWFLGLQAKERDYKFRRPLTTREIVAAERKRFEEWVEEHAVTTDMTQRDQGGGYAIILIHWSWNSWCAALGIDPMGDVE